jgi:SM-20-related protein
VIDLDAISRAKLTHEPFEFFTSAGVLNDENLAAIRRDFPRIDKPGLFPLSSLECGSAFAKLIDEIQSPELAELIGQKFGVSLVSLPLMITVRGWAQAKDGRIHTDTKDKIVTCLLYLNDTWDDTGGRLRLLRKPDDIEDWAAEIPPNGGAFGAFKVTPNSWHGHKPYVGERRYVMFNWVRSEAALSRQIGRHKLSARIKKVVPFLFMER